MAPRPIEVVRFIARSTKRIAITLVGGVLVGGGLAMLVLPGPGLLVVALGFAVLGTEYAWAAAALERTKELAAKGGAMAKGAASRAVSVVPVRTTLVLLAVAVVVGAAAALVVAATT